MIIASAIKSNDLVFISRRHPEIINKHVFVELENIWEFVK